MTKIIMNWYKKAKTVRNVPYLKKIDQIGDLQVWYVDGNYVREHINHDFTNAGQHYRCRYIPKNELWIDKQAKHNETPFFIQYLLIENYLMSKGVSHEEASEKAALAEKIERNRGKDIQKITNNGKTSPKSSDVHEKLWKTLKNGIKVWIVCGKLVRSLFYIDFTAGGHDLVYNFIPKNEIWIDDNVFEGEWKFILLHEIHERNLMAKGLSYDEAHAKANRVEFQCRHHPNKIDKILKLYGEK